MANRCFGLYPWLPQSRTVSVVNTIAANTKGQAFRLVHWYVEVKLARTSLAHTLIMLLLTMNTSQTGSTATSDKFLTYRNIVCNICYCKWPTLQLSQVVVSAITVQFCQLMPAVGSCGQLWTGHTDRHVDVQKTLNALAMPNTLRYTISWQSQAATLMTNLSGGAAVGASLICHSVSWLPQTHAVWCLIHMQPPALRYKALLNDKLCGGIAGASAGKRRLIVRG